MSTLLLDLNLECEYTVTDLECGSTVADLDLECGYTVSDLDLDLECGYTVRCLGLGVWYTVAVLDLECGYTVTDLDLEGGVVLLLTSTWSVGVLLHLQLLTATRTSALRVPHARTHTHTH